MFSEGTSGHTNTEQIENKCWYSAFIAYKHRILIFPKLILSFTHLRKLYHFLWFLITHVSLKKINLIIIYNFANSNSQKYMIWIDIKDKLFNYLNEVFVNSVAILWGPFRMFCSV